MKIDFHYGAVVPVTFFCFSRVNPGVKFAQIVLPRRVAGQA